MAYHIDIFKQTSLHRVCYLSQNVARLGKANVFEYDDQYFSDIILDYITSLRALGADINARDKSGSTPLHVACKRNNRPVVRALLTFPEIQLSVKDQRDCTPLDYSVDQEQVRITALLQDHGAEHSANFKDKFRPLYVPASLPTDKVYPPEDWAVSIRTNRRKYDQEDYITRS